MGPNTQQTRRLLKLYKDAEKAKDAADLGLAEFASEVLSYFETQQGALIWIKNHAKVGGPIAAKLARMGAALNTIPEPSVWKACGWEGIRRLLRLPAEDRASLVKALGSRRKRLTHPQLGDLEKGLLREFEKQFQGTRPRGYSSTQEYVVAICQILGHFPTGSGLQKALLRDVKPKIRREVLAHQAESAEADAA